MADLAINLVFKASDLGASAAIGKIKDNLKGLKSKSLDIGNVAGRKGSLKKDNLLGLGRGISTVGNAVTNVAMASAGHMKEAMMQAVDFERGLQEVVTFGGEAFKKQGDTMKNLREQALKLSSESQFSAQDIIESQRRFAQAGFGPEKLLGSMKPTIDLAVAGMMDLETAVDSTIDTMNSFGLKADTTEEAFKSSTRIADAMSKASNIVKGDVKDFAVSMAYVGTQAHQMGLSVESTLGILTDLAAVNIKGSRGGTSVRQLFSNLLDISKNDKAILKKLGISPKQIAESLRNDDFGSVMEAFDAGFKKMNLDGVAAQTLVGPMFSANAETAFFALLDSFRNKGKGGSADNLMQIRNSTGEAAKMSEELGNTTAAKLAKAENAWNNLKIQIGTEFIPVLTELLPIVSSAIKSFSEFAKNNPTLVKVLGSLAIAVTTVGVVFGPVISAVGSIVTVLGFFGVSGTAAAGVIGTIVGVLSGPVGWIALIVAATAALVAWNGGIDETINDLKGMWNWLVDTSAAMVNWTNDAIESLTGLDLGLKRTEAQIKNAKFGMPENNLLSLGTSLYTGYQNLDADKKASVDKFIDPFLSPFRGQSVGVKEAIPLTSSQALKNSDIKKDIQDLNNRERRMIDKAVDKANNSQVRMDVKITVDQNGKVVSAKATPAKSSGPSLLRGLTTEGM